MSTNLGFRSDPAGFGAIVIGSTDAMRIGGASGDNSGQLFHFQNRVINGDCRIAQRNGVALISGFDMYGGCDRITVGAFGFASVTGTISRGGAKGSPFSSTGYLQALTSVTSTSGGTIRFATRLESENVVDLNGKCITISGNLLQDTGGILQAGIAVYKASAPDDFSSPVLLYTAQPVTVDGAGGTVTKIKASLTLGPTDATNGLWAVVSYEVVGAVSNKNLYIGDFQVEKGSIVTPPNPRPIGTELALCQRYYETLDLEIGGSSSATSRAAWIFKVKKRTVPTIVLGAGSLSNLGVAVGADGVTVADNTGFAKLAAGSTASAEL